MEELNLYCDGGARGNPGPAASAFVAIQKGTASRCKNSFDRFEFFCVLAIVAEAILPNIKLCRVSFRSLSFSDLQIDYGK